ncbi:MAG: chemotaxis response regulator protein-glutamate methylesterase [Lachnospiraceae bacterium]|nr:chemotaxis response regulator protein-glutamate methylesterase [Lachnospiraceae bacterium]
MAKKILVVDDSALMRRLASDIINSDSRYHVEETAKDGKEALNLLKTKHYDAVVLDVNMPVMGGLELLREMRKQNIQARVLMFSSTTGEGTKETIEALELGAVDFIKKPDELLAVKDMEFKQEFLRLLAVVARASLVGGVGTGKAPLIHRRAAPVPIVRTGIGKPDSPEIVLRKSAGHVAGEKIVAIASSTGGPKALQKVIPYLPANLNAPVLLVQHMPAGFTKSLAERLDQLSKIRVKEAADGDLVEKGLVLIAAGGRHMKVSKSGRKMRVYYTDEPPREGVRPAANYMYEALADSPYAEICCTVLTGMGADGTVGIQELSKTKRTYVIAQDERTSAVYGMPKAIAVAGMVNEIVPLERVAEAITRNVGVM